MSRLSRLCSKHYRLFKGGVERPELHRSALQGPRRDDAVAALGNDDGPKEADAKTLERVGRGRGLAHVQRSHGRQGRAAEAAH